MRRFLFISLLVAASAPVAAQVQQPPPMVPGVNNGVPNPLMNVYNHLPNRGSLPQLGDTLTPRFSITTDSVLERIGTKVRVKHCGVGHFFFRLWVRDTVTKTDVVFSADTVAIPTCTAQQWQLAGGDTTKLIIATDTTKSPPR